jgi:hypothetical protein
MDHKIFAKRCITSLSSQQHTQPTICFIDAHRLPQDCERQVQSLRDLPNLLNATKCQRSPSHSRFHRSVLYSSFPPRTPRTSIALNPPIYAPHKNATKLRNSSQSQRKKRCPSRNKNGNSLLSGTLFGCETIKSLTEFARTFLTPSTLITQYAQTRYPENELGLLQHVTGVAYTLSLLLVNKGRALTVAAARSRPLRKRSPALLPLAAVPKRWSREPNHNPVSNRTVTHPPSSYPSAGPGNRTTTRLITRSLAHFHRISSPGHASRPPARPPHSIKQPVQDCWRQKILPGRSPVLNRRS